MATVSAEPGWLPVIAAIVRASDRNRARQQWNDFVRSDMVQAGAKAFGIELPILDADHDLEALNEEP